ncbi:phosphatase PAP2 family protein [Caldibacillus lycopersici]|uniref:Phosphatase PAP2 family protein n=1 Tax=Perspicuibacillus lycopersici TaxID=1325689 RepID=A0AAE3IQF0_9BACI|nr:phosphatase PAP2 family protein [Perspicuibacillus lycopersici]MCU9612502.1 phosphatase PAP2 family protein [Perspicuibacillus lycopersici]
MKKFYWLAIITFILFLGLFLYIGDGHMTKFDEQVQTALAFLDPAIPFFEQFSILGTTIGIGTVTVLLLLWLLFVKKNYSGMVLALLVVGGGNLINKVIKDIIGRERPFGHASDSFSFPSGHAMVGFLCYGLFAYFLTKEVKTRAMKTIIGCIFGLIIFIMGIGRIPVHEHYPTDILAGFSIAFSYFFLCIVIYEAWNGKQRKKKMDEKKGITIHS